MAPDLTIRDARPDELDAVVGVILAAYQEYADSLSPAAWEDYSRNIADVHSRLANSALILAERAGDILGCVTYYPDGSRTASAVWPPTWASLRLLAVRPEVRGQGIARALIEECMRRARERGASTLALHTTHFMVAAMRLYERMGFQRVPEYDIQPRLGITAMAYRMEL